METIKRMIDDARGHLKAASNQMVDSDRPAIICNHVRDALVSLDIALGEFEVLRKGELKRD